MFADEETEDFSKKAKLGLVLTLLILEAQSGICLLVSAPAFLMALSIHEYYHPLGSSLFCMILRFSPRAPWMLYVSSTSAAITYNIRANDIVLATILHQHI